MRFEPILISSMLLLSFNIMGCFSESEVDRKEIFHYELSVNCNDTNQYHLFFPIPIISRDIHPNEGEPTQLMSEINIISGSVSYEINWTDYGYALILTSNSSFSIIAHKEIKNDEIEEDDYIFGHLSMKSGDKLNSPYYIFLNSSSNSTVIIDFQSYWRSIPENHEDFEWKLSNHRLINDWQTVELRYIEHWE